MKILFVEDSDNWVNEFLPQLKTLGEVTHFKSRNATLCALEAEENFDLIVCDHNILMFEKDRMVATGTDIYFHCRFSEINIPFIHFSYEPCPEEYEASQDANFYSLKKTQGAKLLDLISKISNKS